ncbi:MAG: transglycosylase domain-containing protein, partial [Alphaproteobacteria bacterium]|nr:transglycosylase domain-containing protein [Alphaproteobacteria bacterium]
MNKNIKQHISTQCTTKDRIISFCINTLLIITACIGLYVLFVFLQMPSLDSILNETREPVVVFLDKNGNEIRSMGRIMEKPISVDNVPPHVWQAIVSIEDKRFFKHGAIDFRGTMRAVF